MKNPPLPEMAAKIHQTSNAQLLKTLVDTTAALVAANESVADWQSAMFAWKDLAQALRDEIKECPNAEAHKFGKNQQARSVRFSVKEDGERVSRNLKTRYTPEEKGLVVH